MKKTLKGPMILLICAIVWGVAFSAQDTAMEHMGPLTFVCLRSVITSLILFGLSLSFGIFKRYDKKHLRKTFVLGSMLGILLVIAVSLQQIGIVYTTPAKSGFITALYIVMIPVFGLFMRKSLGSRVWIGVGIALIGLALLCLDNDLSVNKGDVITFGCAVVFALHIIFVDRYAADLDPVLLCGVQFGVSAVVSAVPMFILEKHVPSEIIGALPSLLYTAVFSGAIGYTLQFYGQKYTPPTEASLLMCLESFFAAVGGWILLGQRLDMREIIGCCLMLTASLLVQLPSKR